MDLKTRIEKAKIQLMFKHPFFGAIAMMLPAVISKDVVPTAGVDGKRMYFNPDFCEPLSDPELTFLVAHECMHPMLNHATRLGTRDHFKFNMAGDYIINQLLVDEGIGKFIEGGLLDQLIVDRGGTTEGIYAILPDVPQNKQGYGGSGQPYDQVMQSGKTDSEKSQLEQEWKIMAGQALAQAKMAGKLSANLERLVGEILEPKVDWREVLRRFVVKSKTDDRSWARPNRRFAAQGLVLPTVSGEAMGDIMIAVDCSGSISNEILNEFAAEIYGIKDDCMPTNIHVVYFDSEVCHYEKFSRDDELHIEPHGGGGTAFSPVFAFAEENDIQPVCCVFLTDLYCSDFGNPQPYPVLWVSNGANAAPWGEVVMMAK